MQADVIPRPSASTYIDTDYDINYTESYQHEHLSIPAAVSIINNVYNASLTDTSPRQSVPNYDLWPHQEALVAAMISKEHELLSGPYYNSVGILSSPPGSGKTRAVLAHIQYNKSLGDADKLSITKTISHKREYSNTIYNIKIKPSAPTLIIVNDKEYPYWLDEIKVGTTFAYINKPRDLNKIINDDTIHTVANENDIILLNHKLANKALTEFAEAGVTFKRIYVDNPDIMQMKRNTPPLRAGFIWLVTHAWYYFIPRILFYPSTYLRYGAEYDPEWKAELDISVQGTTTMQQIKSYNYFEKMMSYTGRNVAQVIRCRDTFVKASTQRQDPVELSISCALTRKQRSMAPILSKTAMKLIADKDISGVYEELGIEKVSIDDVLKSIRDTFNIAKIMTRLPHADPSGSEEYLTTLREYDNRYNNIRERLMKYEECPICFDPMTVENNTMVHLSCCNACICSGCSLNMITSGCRIKCIYCRRQNTLRDIKAIATGDSIAQQPSVKPKFEQIVEYIKSLPPAAKPVIYANNAEDFHELFYYLRKNSIMPALYNATNSKTQRSLSFSEDVICITRNALYESIRLPFATHIIHFYRLDIDVRRTIIARAHSPQRREPLQVVSFLYQESGQDTSMLLTRGEDRY